MIVGSVIMVTYNSAGSIERCLSTLRAEEEWERVVIDNASRDGSLELAKASRQIL